MSRYLIHVIIKGIQIHFNEKAFHSNTPLPFNPLRSFVHHGFIKVMRGSNQI